MARHQKWKFRVKKKERTMTKIAALTILSLVVFAGGLVSVNSANAWTGSRIFRVTLKSSFGTTFTDCFRFNVPGPGDLSIDLLGQTITYRYGQLNTIPTSFKAVSRSGQPLSIMYYGEELEALEQLFGEAVNEFGDSFVFSGLETATCVSSLDPASSSGTSPYKE
jgi:hypothetical protein